MPLSTSLCQVRQCRTISYANTSLRSLISGRLTWGHHFYFLFTVLYGQYSTVFSFDLPTQNPLYFHKVTFNLSTVLYSPFDQHLSYIAMSIVNSLTLHQECCTQCYHSNYCMTPPNSQFSRVQLSGKITALIA